MLASIVQELQFPAYIGYAHNNARLPYGVVRPVALVPDQVPLSGASWSRSVTIGVYCRAGSVEASFNMALSAIASLDGLAIAGTEATASMGYSGAVVEGAYESMVTVSFGKASQ